MAGTCLVIPCYNEAKRLNTAEYRRFARATPSVSFLMVDDGSTDGTAEVLRELAQTEPDRFSVLRLGRNAGKAEAVRQGILAGLETRAAYVGYWDADLATPLDVVSTFADVLDRSPSIDLVMGSRVQLLGRRIERRPARHYLGRVFATVASLVLGLRVYDTQCGAKLFRATPQLRALFTTPFHSRWIFDVELLARMVRQRGEAGLPPAVQSIHEEPLKEWSDVGGSKLKAADFVVALVDLIRLYRYLSSAVDTQTTMEERVPAIEAEPARREAALPSTTRLA